MRRSSPSPRLGIAFGLLAFALPLIVVAAVA
ncbi:hypothetical protein SAMN05216566_10865 [Aureimonas phyllosphaerae]|uniref:Uncharacterized protein n=1 Tax=Aureimonas phyllosphaerae TaxID=1166078 RepID=A0A7W6BW39_9HYPH|nr:hypothetical protein [Aureimonas phyllosphaerae]MBB3960082.1 hypothetical protein [Aureimonas phyllosphaerae]SFF33078.1 hypothetical protein SAMN05216566_10865 [Aureimonas phyllosphaerae]